MASKYNKLVKFGSFDKNFDDKVCLLMDLQGKYGMPHMSDVGAITILTKYSKHAVGITWLVNVLVSGESRWEDLPILLKVDGSSLVDGFIKNNSQSFLNSSTPGTMTVASKSEDAVASIFKTTKFDLAVLLNPLAQFATFSSLFIYAQNDVKISVVGTELDLLSLNTTLPLALPIFETENFICVNIREYESALWWSTLNTKAKKCRYSWCTSDKNTFSEYFSTLSLFILYDKTGVLQGEPAKWQFCPEDGQFCDANNNQV